MTLRAILPGAACAAWALLLVSYVRLGTGGPRWFWPFGIPAAAFVAAFFLLIHAGTGRGGRWTQIAAALLLFLAPVHFYVLLSQVRF